MKEIGTPSTLLEVVTHFADERRAWRFFVARRWPNGVTCPRCGGTDKIHLIETRRIWRCNDCKEQFSAKTGSIFEDSPITFSKWLPAVWLITNAKNGISSYEVHRALGVTQKTAWFMLQRIRLAMQNGTIEKLSGHVEADETFVGGKEINKHKSKRLNAKGGSVGKTVVWGAIQREGRVIAKVVADHRVRTLQSALFTHVEEGSNLYTDAYAAYQGLGSFYQHAFVDHAASYVEGQVHTNGLENFWSLLKRSIKGTYVSVEPFHLSRYLDEQMFRYNERKLTDGERFAMVCGMTDGKRLTYAELTGKVAQA